MGHGNKTKLRQNQHTTTHAATTTPSAPAASNQGWTKTLTNLLLFPYYHPTAFGMLVLTVSGGIAAHMLYKQNMINDAAAKQRAENCKNHYTTLYGNPETADLILYAENHTLQHATWDCIETYGGSQPTVLVENVPSGFPIACEDSMLQPRTGAKTFKPTCIGSDTKNPAFYQEEMEIGKNASMKKLMVGFYEDYQKSGGNEKVFAHRLQETIVSYQNAAKYLEDEHGFSSANVKAMVTFSMKEVQYRRTAAVLNELKAMQKQLKDGKTAKKILKDFGDEKLLQPLYQGIWRNEQAFVKETTERGKAMGDTIVSVASHAQPGQKIQAPMGFGHVIPQGGPGDPAVRHMLKTINTPALKNRFAILATRHHNLVDPLQFDMPDIEDNSLETDPQQRGMPNTKDNKGKPRFGG